MTNYKILGGMIHHPRSSHNAMKTAAMQLLLHFASLAGNDLPPTTNGSQPSSLLSHQ